MVGYVNQGVPTSVDLENNSSQKKYTVNHPKRNSNLTISKALCTLMAIGAILLAVLVGLIVFFTVARCNQDNNSFNNTDIPEALIYNNMLLNKENSVDERLPTNVWPLHYIIQIHPNYENNIFNGLVDITLNITKETNQIIFHLDNIEINKEKLSLKSLNDTENKLIKINQADYIEGQRYKIVLNNFLNVNQHYLLQIEYNGHLNQQLQGFYKSEYEDEANTPTKSIYTTQFSPTDARKAFPCFDEPIFKSTFSINIARPAYLTTLSNMPLRKTQDFFTNNSVWYWDYYEETPKMPTYLVAFVVNDLKLSPQTRNSLIRIWSRNIYSQHTGYAGNLTKTILDFFEDYFHIRFPLTKIDIVAVPQFGFNAMENWGLITFRESSLLFDNRKSTVHDKRTIATVLAHEIAHQWFGNLVTPKWWNDLWLKEGFATYLQYLGVNYSEPKWNILEEFLPYEIHRAFKIDSLETSRPISFSVKNNQQIRQTFDEISYAKGASIIRMMNHFVGEETFKNGLINYLNKFQYGNADRYDLFTSLQEEANRNGIFNDDKLNIKDIMSSWTEQAGFPVLTIIPNRNASKLIIRQKRFLLTDKPSKNLWWIPISLTTSHNYDFDDTKTKYWLKNVEEIQIDYDFNMNRWYLMNLNQTGYYIVNYDDKNWLELIDNIDKFPKIIRAQLISDSMDLARANLLDYNIPLRLIARMVLNDHDILFVPTLTALEKLEFLYDMLINTPAFGLFNEYILAIFHDDFDIVSFVDDNDEYLVKRIRSMILKWSCKRPESTCENDSRRSFRMLMVHNTQVPANLQDVCYCTAIREGTEAEWMFAYKRYEEIDSISEKNTLLDALGCTKIKWLLARYLNDLYNENSSIKIQDADRVFESVAKNPYGTEIAFNFLRNNWNELQQRFGDGFNIMARMVKALAPRLNTKYQLNELKRFRDSINSNLSTTIQAFDNAIEIVYSNVLWMEKNYVSIENWLEQNKNHFKYL